MGDTTASTTPVTPRGVDPDDPAARHHWWQTASADPNCPSGFTFIGGG